MMVPTIPMNSKNTSDMGTRKEVFIVLNWLISPTDNLLPIMELLLSPGILVNQTDRHFLQNSTVKIALKMEPSQQLLSV